MSLNWKELDTVLSELDIVGAQIQRIIQPAYDTVVLSLYKPGKATELLFCVGHGACRMHATTQRLPKPPGPQRFTELLRAHVRGARIETVHQLGADRIVLLDIGQGDGRYLLYARLWSGAANLILTRPDGTIVDVLTRKPSKGEVAGGRYAPEPGPAPSREFTIREFAADAPGIEATVTVGPSASVTDAATIPYNARVDAWYAEHGSELSREAFVERAIKYFDQKRTAAEIRLASLRSAGNDGDSAGRWRELADILMANPMALPVGRSVELDDFYRGGRVVIQIDPARTLVDNARTLYDKAKKAATSAAETATGLADAEAALAGLKAERERVLALDSAYAIRAFLARNRGPVARTDRHFPGLSLEKGGWLMLIGRSASENDELLRRHVRGNDTWFHARDHAGSYVFVKARAGKTIPLDIMLDAGTLALYYSKARNSGGGDLYYTSVKYLRRAKNGPKGLVIPTQEKNLHVTIDEARLRDLKHLIGSD